MDLGFTHQPVWQEDQYINVLTPLYDLMFAMIFNVIIVAIITGADTPHAPHTPNTPQKILQRIYRVKIIICPYTLVFV